MCINVSTHEYCLWFDLSFVQIYLLDVVISLPAKLVGSFQGFSILLLRLLPVCPFVVVVVVVDIDISVTDF